jgi:hypothetical protein
MSVWEVSYDILRPLDQHPTGPRCMAVKARTAEAAARKVAVWYDVKVDGEYLRIRAVRRPGPRFGGPAAPLTNMPRS